MIFSGFGPVPNQTVMRILHASLSPTEMEVRFGSGWLIPRPGFYLETTAAAAAAADKSYDETTLRFPFGGAGPWKSCISRRRRFINNNNKKNKTVILMATFETIFRGIIRFDGTEKRVFRNCSPGIITRVEGKTD